jgi:hypothetical protein
MLGGENARRQIIGRSGLAEPRFGKAPFTVASEARGSFTPQYQALRGPGRAAKVRHFRGRSDREVDRCRGFRVTGQLIGVWVINMPRSWNGRVGRDSAAAWTATS